MFKRLSTYFFSFFTLICISQETNIKQVDSLLNTYKEKSELTNIQILASKTSRLFYKKKDYKNAVKYSKIVIETEGKVTDSILYKKSLFYHAHFLHKDKQFYKSIQFYNVVIDSFKVDKRTFLAYNELGRVYKDLGDYSQAQTYFKKGLSKPSFFNNKELYKKSINAAIISDHIGTEKSINNEFFLLKKADSLSSLFNLTYYNYYSLNFTFADYYKNDLVFDFQKSKEHYLKVFKRAKKNNDSLTMIKVCNNYSELLIKVKSDSAYYYIQQGIKLSKKSNPALSKLHYQLSEYYLNKGKINEAIKSTNKALLLITSNNLEISKRLKFYLLKQKSILLLKKKRIDNVKSALKNIHLADKLLDVIKQESLEKQSKLFWQKEASEIYLQGVEVALLLNKPEEILYFIEKNKALLLLENISESQLRKQINIPVEILEEELRLKQKINSLENKLNKNSTQKDSLENEYYSTKIELNNFILSLEKSYPTYYKYKKPIDIIKLQEVQSSLDTKTMVLEYILDDSEGYLLTITKNKKTIHKLDSVKNIHKKINTYLKLISQPITTKKEQENYNTIAYELYASLFPFSKNELTQKIIKLIIIPDYTLQNIPFESLKTTNNNYLINDYEISYAYSLSFLEKNKTSTKTTVEDFIGFAPYNFNYDNLTGLKNSRKEIKNATNYFSGVSLTDNLATKQRFLDNVEDYNIIHLATHAVANDSISSPWIAFRNKKLHLNELYTLETSADLVVLSACKTSLGKINKGEGVFSLARGFFYSGSKSVVSSLWNVNDKSSQEILSDFYANLKNGKTKSEALRQAKLNYINTHQLSEQSPYYWSSFILIGDTTAISSDSFSEYYSYLFILFLIILGLFLYRKRIK